MSDVPVTPAELQKRCVAILAVNALAGLGMKPAPKMLERAGAPPDDLWSDPDVVRNWGLAVEFAHSHYRARPILK